MPAKLSTSESQSPVPGYHGRYLVIDLGTGCSQAVPLEEVALRRFLGGSGLGVYLLLSRQCAGVDPLAPEAPLAFVFSPLVGSPLTTSAKFVVAGKSPLTERINDSLVSGHFALAGKRTGYDALVLVGRAAEPSVVVVDQDGVRLEPAGRLWGTTCRQAEGQLRNTLGPDYSIAAIGPAGERMVRYAAVSHDGRHAGRGGNGAVLGSKNVKALAVAGSRHCRWARPEQLVEAGKALSQKSLGPATAGYRELGTAANLLLFNRLGTLPTRNFQQGRFERADELSAERLEADRGRTRKSCASCTIGCEHLYPLEPAAGKSADHVRLEYESLFALGPLCGVGDAQLVLQASKRCDELGLDTISAGGTVAFAMECVSRGLLDAPWLRFGDGSALLRALDEIGHRRGLGKLLAEGSRRAAIQIGHDSIDFAPQVKGLEIPGYEPRALQTMALGFAVGTRGADHNRSGAYQVDFSAGVDRRNPDPSAVAQAVETEDRAALLDSLILCKFLRGVFDDFFGQVAELLNLATGWDTTADELRQTARRIVTAKKLFNVQAGWQPAEDTLPARFFDEPLPGDPRARLSREKLSRLIAAYHAQRGWSPEGWISCEQLEKLALDQW